MFQEKEPSTRFADPSELSKSQHWMGDGTKHECCEHGVKHMVRERKALDIHLLKIHLFAKRRGSPLCFLEHARTEIYGGDLYIRRIVGDILSCSHPNL